MKRSAIQTRDLGTLFALDPQHLYSFAGAFVAQNYGPTAVCLEIVHTGLNVDVPSEGAGRFYMSPDQARRLARQLQTAADEVGKSSASEEKPAT